MVEEAGEEAGADEVATVVVAEGASDLIDEVTALNEAAGAVVETALTTGENIEVAIWVSDAFERVEVRVWVLEVGEGADVAPGGEEYPEPAPPPLPPSIEPLGLMVTYASSS